MPETCIVTFEPFAATAPFAQRFGLRQGDIYGQSTDRIQLSDNTCRRLLAMPVVHPSGDITAMSCNCPDGTILTARPTPNADGDIVWQVPYDRARPCTCVLRIDIIPYLSSLDIPDVVITRDIHGWTTRPFPYPWDERDSLPCYPRETLVEITYPAELVNRRTSQRWLFDFSNTRAGHGQWIRTTNRSTSVRTPSEAESFPCQIDSRGYYVREDPPPPCPEENCNQCPDLNVSVSLADKASLANCGEFCRGFGHDLCAPCLDSFCQEWQSSIEDRFPIRLEQITTGIRPTPLSCGAGIDFYVDMRGQRCGPFPHPDPEPYWLGWGYSFAISLHLDTDYNFDPDDCGRARGFVRMTAAIMSDPFRQWDHTVNYCFVCDRPYYGGAAIDVPNDWIDLGMHPSIQSACAALRTWVEMRNPWTFVDLNNTMSRFLQLNFEFS